MVNRHQITQRELQRALATLDRPSRLNRLLALPLWAIVRLVRAATSLARRLPRRK